MRTTWRSRVEHPRENAVGLVLPMVPMVYCPNVFRVADAVVGHRKWGT